MLKYFWCVFLLFFGLTKSIAAEEITEFNYVWLKDEKLALEIGEKLFNEPGEGCWTCHGTDGAGTSNKTTDAGNETIKTDLRNVQTWTSYKIVSQYKAKDKFSIGQRDIAISLVRLGATEWNNNMVPIIRSLVDTETVFFDDRMIGIHSKYLKKNSKSVIRKLKKNKVKFKSEELMDVMATSVFEYLEKHIKPSD